MPLTIQSVNLIMINIVTNHDPTCDRFYRSSLGISIYTIKYVVLSIISQEYLFSTTYGNLNKYNVLRESHPIN